MASVARAAEGLGFFAGGTVFVPIVLATGLAPPKKEKAVVGAGGGAGACAGAGFGVGPPKNENGFVAGFGAAAGAATGLGARAGVGVLPPKRLRVGLPSEEVFGWATFGAVVGLAPPKKENGSFLATGAGAGLGTGFGAGFRAGAVLGLPKIEAKASVTGSRMLT